MTRLAMILSILAIVLLIALAILSCDNGPHEPPTVERANHVHAIGYALEQDTECLLLYKGRFNGGDFADLRWTFLSRMCEGPIHKAILEAREPVR